MKTLLSFPCQLGLGVVLRYHSLSPHNWLIFLVLSPIKSLFQITQRYKTSRTFTTNIFNIVKKLLISATLVLKSHDETYLKASKSPNIHLAKGRSEQAANTFDLYY